MLVLNLYACECENMLTSLMQLSRKVKKNPLSTFKITRKTTDDMKNNVKDCAMYYYTAITKSI